MKTHDKEIFYKYTTSDTAKKIITNLNTRWSSPKLLNDPFDTQLHIRYDFDFPEFINEYCNKIVDNIYDSSQPSIKLDHHLRNVVERSRKIINKPLRDSLKEKIKQLLLDTQSSYEEILKSSQSGWENHLMTFKVFCVAEECDNLLMWSHYAESHTGVVFGFKCLPEYDTSLCGAAPINYQNNVPMIGPVDSYVENLLFGTGLDMDQKSREFIYTKSKHWSYEKEWRVATYREELNKYDYVDFEILPEEIDILILGCRISEEDKQELLEIIDKSDLKHTKIYQSEKNEDQFALKFNQFK